MNIQNLVVAFNGSEASVAALNYAAASVRQTGGHVTALLAHATNEVVNSRDAWVPPAARAIIADANASILEEIKNRFEAIKTELDLGDRLHFISAAGRVDAVLSECARSFDMILIGQDGVDELDAHVVIHPDRVALMSGRPVLAIPPSYKMDAPHTHAAIAWDGSRASARALSDSLRLIKQQGSVTVLTVGDNALPRPIEELMNHLQRQSVEATHQHLTLKHSIADTLVSFCEAYDPCLLVMGAYEHSKFREDFFGGMTTEVLKRLQTPLLISH